MLVNDQGDNEESRRGVGLDNIAGCLREGMPALINVGLPFERKSQLSAEEVRYRSKDKLVLDVRNEAE